MTAQFNPEVRALYDEIIRRNANRDNFEYMPPRYGGGRVREEVLPGTNGHYPSNEVIEASNMGGFYGRASHPIAVGSGRKCGGVGVLKHAKAEPMMNELDMDYMPVSASHGAGRAPRLTKRMKDQILAEHPMLMKHHMSGGKIDWGKIWKGIKDTASFVSKAAPIAQQLAPEEYKDTIGKVGNVSGTISGLGRKRAGSLAHMAAIDLAKRAMSKRKSGAGWKEFAEGFKKGFKGTAKVASPILDVASVFQPELAPVALGVHAVNAAMGGRHVRRAGRKQLPRSGHKREVARGDIVAAIMKQRGVGLGEASRIVKQEGLY
jgi:hypothetical protein